MGHMLVYTIGDVVTRFRRAERHARPPSPGLRLVRPAGRERRHQRGRPPAREHRAQHRHHHAVDAPHRLGVRLVAAALDAPARVLPLAAVAVPRVLRARARVPEGGARSSGARTTRRCSRTSRCATVAASGAAPRSSRASWSSGSSGSPTTQQALLDDLDTVDWPESIKARQRNWIGRSEGAEILFRIEELGEDVPVFTTRPDTLFGATFFVLAPEHELVARIESPEVRRLRAPCLGEEDRGARRRRPRRRASSPGCTRSTP